MRENGGRGEEKRRRKAGEEGENKCKKEEGERGEQRREEESKGGEPDNMPRLARKRDLVKFEKSRVGATRRDEKA